MFDSAARAGRRFLEFPFQLLSEWRGEVIEGARRVLRKMAMPPRAYEIVRHTQIPCAEIKIALHPSHCAKRRSCRHPLQKERSEEHTSELQSHVNLLCRLL